MTLCSLSFGFGGRIVTTKAQFRNGRKAYRRAGNVKVSYLNSIATQNHLLRKVNEFPGPLTADIKDQFKVHGTTVALRKFINDRMKIAEQMKVFGDAI